MESVQRMVITFAFLYSILLQQTMHSLNDRRISVAFKDSNFLPEVGTFQQNFVTFNTKSVGLPRLKHTQSSTTSSAPSIWPRNGRIRQDDCGKVYF